MCSSDLLIRDGEICANLIANGDHANGKAAALQMPFQALARIAAGDQDGQGLAAEGVDDARGVDAAPTRRFAAGIDVGAVLEGQTIDIDDVIDGRIDGKGDDQETILTGRYYRRWSQPSGGSGAPLNFTAPALPLRIAPIRVRGRPSNRAGTRASGGAVNSSS